MALIPIRIDRTSKPPLGTPLRSDGHWSVQGLVGAWAFNEGAGGLVDAVTQNISPITGTPIRSADGVEFVAGSACKVKEGFRTPAFTTVFEISNPTQSYSSKYLLSNYDQGIGKNFFITFNDSTGVFSLSVENSGYSTYAAYATDSQSVASKSIKAFGIFDGVNVTVGNGNVVAVTAFSGSYQTFTNVPLCIGGIISGSSVVGSSAGTIIKRLYYYASVLTPQQVASLSANPWQIFEPETVWIEVGGGGVQSLFDGAIYGQSSASAQLSTAITIASQVVAAGGIAGGINTAISLATSTQGYGSPSALLTTAIRMAASATGAGSVSAPLSTSIRLGASAQGSGSTAAGITTSIRLGSTTAGASSATANLSTVIALAAEVLAASNSSGALTTAIRFGGALSGSSTTTAALTNAVTMAAQAAGLGSISGQLSGTIAAALFAGTISGSSSASANLSTAVVLAAAAQGNSTAQAALSTALELAAQVNGIGSAVGSLGAGIPGLSGSLSGSSEAQATLATAIHLMGLAAGQCGVVGRLAEPVEILAQLRVMASDPLALIISVRDPLALRVTVH